MKNKNTTSYSEILAMIPHQRFEEIVKIFISTNNLVGAGLFFIDSYQVKEIFSVDLEEYDKNSWIDNEVKTNLHRNETQFLNIDQSKKYFQSTEDNKSGIFWDKEVFNLDQHHGLVLLGVSSEKTDKTPLMKEFLTILKGEVNHANLRKEFTQTTQELHTLEQKLNHEQLAIDSLQEGYVQQNDKGEIISWNQAALDILHMTADQIHGKTSDDPVWNTIYEDGDPYPSKEHPAMIALKTKRPVRNKIMGLVDPQDSTKVSWIRINSYPVQIENKWYTSTLFIDVTQDVTLKNQLAVAENRWHLALESSHQGVWDWNILDQKLFVSNQWKRMYGYSPDNAIDSLEGWTNRIHPEDREKSLKALQEVLDGKKDVYEARYRVVVNDGEIKYHLDRGAIVERGSNGTPTRMVGAAFDETEKVQVVSQLKEVKDYIIFLLDSLPIAAMILTSTRKISYKNHLVDRLLALESKELSSKEIEKMFPDTLTRSSFLRSLQFMEKGWHEFNVIGKNNHHIQAKWKFERFQEDTILVLMKDIEVERRLEDAKTEFVSMASHQLRTPLTSLKWNIELLQDSNIDCLELTQVDQIREMKESTYRMIGLVNSLLNVSRIEMGTFAINSTSINLKEHTTKITDQFRDLANKKNISIDILYEVKEEYYLVDPVIYEVLVENLISNALKYANYDSDILVKLYHASEDEHLMTSAKDNSIIIQIQNEGIGIPEKEKGAIFSRLYRASNAIATNTIGTGIGLYMIKKIVKEIGGDIWFTSKENETTSFFIHLPGEGIPSRDGVKSLKTHSVQE